MSSFPGSMGSSIGLSLTGQPALHLLQTCTDIGRRLHGRWLAHLPKATEAAGDSLDGRPRRSARPIAIQVIG